jgi:hypothetical protein
MIDDAGHYLGAVSAMAGSHEMSAAEDIVSASGILLVARGTRIGPGLREKLSGHRLSGTVVEKSLAVAGGVTAASLAVDIARTIDGDPWFVRLAAKSGDPAAMRHGASRLKLPHEILFRLSLARDQRPALYRHSLGVAIISHYLALRSKLKPAPIDSILVAALCHDLGELHTDPAILEPGHRVTDEERQFIYVHPITGWLIVRDLAGLDPEIARAVLQHQERLDGSGYPYGKKDKEIGMAGRILAAADVSETIMARFGDHRRLTTLLRLNQRKYDRNVLGLLHEAVGPEAEAVPFERETQSRHLTGFAAILEGWSRLRAETGIARSAAGPFLSERMFNLRTVVIQFGFDPDSLEMLLGLAEEDASIAAELTAVIDELQFQLADLGREYDRRAPAWKDGLDPIVGVALDDWRQQLQACIST